MTSLSFPYPRTFSWQIMGQSSSGTLVQRVFWTGTGRERQRFIFRHYEANAQSVLNLLLLHSTFTMFFCKCAAAQRPTLIHMSGHHTMWLQKSGTTSRTTIRGMFSYIFSWLSILYGTSSAPCWKISSPKYKRTKKREHEEADILIC